MIGKLKITLQQKAFFLWLLPLFFILHGYNAFFGFFPATFVLYNFLTIIGFAFLCYVCTVFRLKHKQGAAIFTFLLLLLFLSFGILHDFIKQHLPGILSRYSVLLPGIALLVFFIFRYFKRKRTDYVRTFLFLNVLMLSFLGFELADGVWQWINFQNGKNYIDHRFNAYRSIKTVKAIDNKSKPDIYLLIFDALPSTIAMANEWNYNNSQLDSFLLKQDFFVAPFSKSNYNLTALSMASMLNMDYTVPVNLYEDETKMYFKASATILDNSLTRFLTDQQYSIKQYQPVSFNNKDWDGTLFFGDMLYKNYFYQTLPGRMYRDLKWSVSERLRQLLPSKKHQHIQKQNKQQQADLLKTIGLVKQSCNANNDKPKFIYAHFQLPHDPFIYDSTGKLKAPEKTYAIKEKDQPLAFIEQVKYSNKVITELVKHIKQNNKHNTIIVIAGDHGYRNAHGTRSYMVFDNFSSYYFPDKQYQPLTNTISPVNSFRVILNKYFNAGLPLLKDSSIFIPYTLPGIK